MTKAHSIIGFSGAARRIQCPASVKLQEAYPPLEQDPSGPEGDAAHWVLEQLLTRGAREPQVGELAPNGIMVTLEMIEGAEMCADDVKTTLGQDWHLIAFVEHTIAARRLHPQSFGTPDVYAWLARQGGPARLFVWEFKYGHGYVEVVGNAQMVDQVAAIMDEAKIDGGQDQTLGVVCRIVQPRSYHRDGPIREWAFVASDIRAQINVSSNASHEALGLNPRAATGPECDNCSARRVCSTLQASSYKAVDVSNRSAPLELAGVALGQELSIVEDAIARLEARKSGLEAQVLGSIKAGKAVPGYLAAQSVGREAWAIPAAQVGALGRALGIELLNEPEPITPTQARKAGVSAEVMSQVAARPTGALKLERDSGQTLSKIFKP